MRDAYFTRVNEMRWDDSCLTAGIGSLLKEIHDKEGRNYQEIVLLLRQVQIDRYTISGSQQNEQRSIRSQKCTF